jgi:hypothetical protein
MFSRTFKLLGYWSMTRSPRRLFRCIPFCVFAFHIAIPFFARAEARFIDCSASQGGDGTSAHPWNSLALAQDYRFQPGDRIALKRGTVCHGSFAPQGSGTAGGPIRLTAYGEGSRPQIVASNKDRQALLLSNQEYWQIDSLDVSGSSTYGVFVTGDKGTMHHISLKNLFVHDVRGGEIKSKDNGLVVVGPTVRGALFDDVLVDGVIAQHTDLWVGILVGGGNYADQPGEKLNTHITVRNSSVQDVVGDGIILFRDSDGLIETSDASETGMQPTQTIGTPNAIWTWTCTDCVVRDSEAYLTDSPGVDGGAFDIDWNNTRNTVERNYGHDTQGYCFAVFAAGYVTHESVVRDNLCINNGLSPRLAALQGAAYLLTWNGGVVDGLRIEHNRFVWEPTVAGAAAIVDDAEMRGSAAFVNNEIDSASSRFYRTNAQFAPAGNVYRSSGSGDAAFTLGERRDATLQELQRAGLEQGSKIARADAPTAKVKSLRMDADVELKLDGDGLLDDAPRAQLMVLRSLARQYGSSALAVTVHLAGEAKAAAAERTELANALLDLDAGPIRFEHDGKGSGAIQLMDAEGHVLKTWRGFANAATLGGAVRERLGAPHFLALAPIPAPERKQ